MPEEWARKTGPAVASDGKEIAWSAIDPADNSGLPAASDLVSVEPFQIESPRVVYRHPDRDSLIWTVVVRSGHYAFVEMNERLLGATGWRLWSLARAGAKAVLLDQSDPALNPPRPGVVLTADRVIWTTVHARGGVADYELRTARIDGSDVHTLLSAPMAQVQYWFPSIDPAGRYVLYATAEHAASGWRFGIFRLDLETGDGKPVRLGDSNVSTQPISNGTTLAWRVVDHNVMNWSTSLVVSRADGSKSEVVPVSSAIDLSIGSRFLAYDSLQEGDLTLYDTGTGQFVIVEHHSPSEMTVMQRGWTLVAGDLLVFRRIHPGDDAGLAKPPEACWATLPL